MEVNISEAESIFYAFTRYTHESSSLATDVDKTMSSKVKQSERSQTYLCENETDSYLGAERLSLTSYF